MDIYGDTEKDKAIWQTIIKTRICILFNSVLFNDSEYHISKLKVIKVPIIRAKNAINRKINRNNPNIFSSASCPPSVFAFIRYRVTADPRPKEISPK